MDIEKLIERLKEPDCDECTYEEKRECAGSAKCVLSGYAAEALSTLQAENESLKEKLYDGEGVNLVDYWMQQAKIEENGHRNCQAENEKLREKIEDARLKGYAKGLSEMSEENEKLQAELEQVKVERDAAVALVHEWEEYGRYLSPMGFTVPPNWKEDLQE